MFKVRPKPIVITHVPKTAGTSLHHYLRTILGDRLVLDYPLHPPPKPNGLRKLLYKLGYKRAILPRGVTCIMGHFPSTKYDEIFADARHAIWFRDPVEQMISMWQYLRRKTEIFDEDWTNVSLMEFAALEKLQNYQEQWLGERPLEDFEMVGVAEHFEVSVQLFSKIFDLPPPDEIPRENVNPNRSGDHRYILSPEQRQQILNQNVEVVQLHAEATKRFQNLCEEYGIELPEQTGSKPQQCIPTETNPDGLSNAA